MSGICEHARTPQDFSKLRRKHRGCTYRDIFIQNFEETQNFARNTRTALYRAVVNTGRGQTFFTNPPRGPPSLRRRDCDSDDAGGGGAVRRGGR